MLDFHQGLDKTMWVALGVKTKLGWFTSKMMKRANYVDKPNPMSPKEKDVRMVSKQLRKHCPLLKEHGYIYRNIPLFYLQLEKNKVYHTCTNLHCHSQIYILNGRNRILIVHSTTGPNFTE